MDHDHSNHGSGGENACPMQMSVCYFKDKNNLKNVVIKKILKILVSWWGL